MSILQNLPFSLCESGPEEVDGVGNFYLQVLAPAPSQLPLSSLYFLDSHGQIPSKTQNPDYDPIKQSQIDWFLDITEKEQTLRKRDYRSSRPYISLVFLHIPLPEFRDNWLRIWSGDRREPTECPSSNTHFYDALAKRGISALGCGHDHVNDFCANLRNVIPQNSHEPARSGPWLCYGGGCGFGGYCSYGSKRFHRRVRVWEIETDTGSLKTWKRVEYAMDRAD